MQQEKQQLDELFQKYQQGLVSEEEKAIIARWLVQLDISGQLSPEQLLAREELSRKGLQEHFFPGYSPSAKIIRFPLWLRSVAASLLLVSAVVAVLYFNNNRRARVNPISFQQISTATGQMKIVTLGDGTRITLNNKSQLKYPETFNGKTREVFLTGEAFFEVAHNAAKPFKVHTGQLDVQVLGTSFNVQAYGDEKELSVAVASGKVGVFSTTSKAHKTYMLLPGDQLAYDPATDDFSRSRLGIANVAAWQNGRFLFKNEKLENITRQLERYYKVSFVFKNKALLSKQISLKTKNQSISTIMKALSISGAFRYKIDGTTITVW